MVCMMFGVGSSVCSLFLCFEIGVLPHALRSDMNAKVCMPINAKLEAFGLQ